MRETNKAKQAFEDYFNMGPGRSLRALHEEYCQRTKDKPPTKRFETIATWSTKHHWQDRIAQREHEIAQAQFEAIKERAIESSYAYWPKRVKDLIELAELLLEEIQTEDKRWLPDVKQIGGGEFAERVDIVRFNSALIEQFRRTLDDIASEVGERISRHAVVGAEEGPVIIKVIRDGIGRSSQNST